MRRVFGRLGLPGLDLDKPFAAGESSAPLQLIGTKYGPGGGGETDALAGDMTHVAASSRHRHDMPSWDATLERIGYANYRQRAGADGALAGPNAINVKAAWEDGDGYHPLFLSGDRVGVLAPDDILFYVPESPIDIDGGSLPYSRQRVSVDVAAEQWPINRIAHGSVNGLGESDNQFGSGAGTDQVDATGTFGSNSATYSFGPAILLGRPRDGVPKPAIMVIGDSIQSVSGADSGPNYGNENGYAGTFERHFGSQHAMLNASRSSSRLQGYAAGWAKTASLLQWCSHLAVMLGCNDWSTGRTLQQMKDDLATIVEDALAVKPALSIWVGTSTPKVTATANAYLDGGTTAASGNSVREGWNTWLRDGSAATVLGIAGIVDHAAGVEDPERAGRFLPSDPALTNDGTHLTAAAHALLPGSFEDFEASLA